MPSWLKHSRVREAKSSSKTVTNIVTIDVLKIKVRRAWPLNTFDFAYPKKQIKNKREREIEIRVAVVVFQELSKTFRFTQ